MTYIDMSLGINILSNAIKFESQSCTNNETYVVIDSKHFFTVGTTAAVDHIRDI